MAMVAEVVEQCRFSAAVAALERGAANVSPLLEWTQGRSLFGGLVVAAALRAMRRCVAPDRCPRALLVSFVGPVVTGPLRLAPTVLREGSAVTQVEARVLQRGEPRCTVQAAFGAQRASSIVVGAPAPPAVPGPEGLPELPYLPGIVPAFTRQFAYRLAAGALPFSAARTAEIGGWIRFREDPSPAAVEEQAVALLDAWPSPVLALLSAHAPASSLTWTIELVRPCAAVDPRGWWYYHATADAAEGGYAHSHATLWGPDGQVFALGRQSVSVFG